MIELVTVPQLSSSSCHRRRCLACAHFSLALELQITFHSLLHFTHLPNFTESERVSEVCERAHGVFFSLVFLFRFKFGSAYTNYCTHLFSIFHFISCNISMLKVSFTSFTRSFCASALLFFNSKNFPFFERKVVVYLDKSKKQTKI